MSTEPSATDPAVAEPAVGEPADLGSEEPGSPDVVIDRSELPPGAEIVARRLPRRTNFVRFILTGAVIGFIVGGILGLLPSDPGDFLGRDYSVGTQVTFTAMMIAAVGALLAAVVAVLLDARARRRATR